MTAKERTRTCKKRSRVLSVLLASFGILYAGVWWVNANHFTKQTEGYKHTSHNSWFKEEGGYIYTITKPSFPAMYGCYVVSDKNDTLSLFVWKNSFSSEYEAGMEVYDENSKISYQFITSKDFVPSDESLNTFSEEEKKRLNFLVEEKQKIILEERSLAGVEWGLW